MEWIIQPEQKNTKTSLSSLECCKFETADANNTFMQNNMRMIFFCISNVFFVQCYRSHSFSIEFQDDPEWSWKKFQDLTCCTDSDATCYMWAEQISESVMNPIPEGRTDCQETASCLKQNVCILYLRKSFGTQEPDVKYSATASWLSQVTFLLFGEVFFCHFHTSRGHLHIK